MIAALKHQVRILKEFRNSLFGIYLKETNIVGVEVNQEMEYGIDEVSQVISNIKFLAGDKKYLILVKAGPQSTISFEAMRLLATPDAMGYAHAKAYVINTLSQRIMGNFFLRYFKPKVPIKFFKDTKNAEVWLLKNFRHLCR
jgi:hypothetical protein